MRESPSNLRRWAAGDWRWGTKGVEVLGRGVEWVRLSAGGNAKDGINDRGPACFELVIRWWFANGFLIPRPDEEEILNPGLLGNDNTTDALEENGRGPVLGVEGVQKSNPQYHRHHPSVLHQKRRAESQLKLQTFISRYLLNRRRSSE